MSINNLALSTNAADGELSWLQVDKNWTDIQAAVNALMAAGYITQTQAQELITSSTISAALGFTPANASSLSKIASTGSYSDLSNKPTIPVLPSNVSAFTNDANYQNASQVNTAIKAIVGAAPAALDTLQEIAAQLQSDESAASALTTLVSQKANISSLPSSATSAIAGLVLLAAGQTSNQLSNVATTGSYSDLTGQPTIPAAQIQSDWNQTNSLALDYIKNKPTISSGSSGALKLISTQSLSNGSCQFTGLSGYGRYKLEISGNPQTTSGLGLQIQVGYGTTPTYITSGYKDIMFFQFSNAADYSSVYKYSNASSSGLFGFSGLVGQQYSKINLISMDIFNALTSNIQALYSAFADNTTTEFHKFDGASSIAMGSNTLTAIAVNLYQSSGSWSGGTASLYGISQ